MSAADATSWEVHSLAAVITALAVARARAVKAAAATLIAALIPFTADVVAWNGAPAVAAAHQ